MHRKMILPLLFGLIGAAILVGLGTWQVQRLAWKEGVIARAEAQMQAAPAPLPATPDPEADRYRPVRVEGRFLGPEAHVLTSIPGEGPGFLVIAAFETAQGRRILIDRGFLPEDQKTTPRPAQAASLSGNLIWPDDVTTATPAPDTARNIWFGRDVEAMAEALHTDPLMMVAREPTGQGITPRPVTVTFTNNHLGYAITWFSLAFAWLGMTVLYLWRIRRRSNEA
ncbi:MAG: SURF1 family protein [Gemmobacter sp.]|uniref:SURF1 family protein n=1 Tax=Gemmobacter sp. TaxID=1898957 RepID=UPI001A4237FE|nr:SURF1 family protein [Gemmobacter sp.]MBL8561461.1 SURF1 family protein [Gemmobacter sp.]